MNSLEKFPPLTFRVPFILRTKELTPEVFFTVPPVTVKVPWLSITYQEFPPLLDGESPFSWERVKVPPLIVAVPLFTNAPLAWDTLSTVPSPLIVSVPSLVIGWLPASFVSVCPFRSSVMFFPFGIVMLAVIGAFNLIVSPTSASVIALFKDARSVASLTVAALTVIGTAITNTMMREMMLHCISLLFFMFPPLNSFRRAVINIKRFFNYSTPPPLDTSFFERTRCLFITFKRSFFTSTARDLMFRIW